ncbi:hypothetical protein KDA_36160 [Dictyobacter alpinus]|uniref:HTH cro/C1-type domain-containing protein n=1 Tax=Dictyobacter alpinus TaxID=2014873 RepID=A0A402BA03_9CHLR|nr:helix-turn-helix transcriptional regulator [Dictyobacter alpinus]GCE28132.1 hypothetical protein KDA_36160 [Dictyobacter alpinus]
MNNPKGLSAEKLNQVHSITNNFTSLFGEEVKYRRLSLQLTQADLTHLLCECGIEITQSYISRLEAGSRKDPSIKLVLALATILSISLDKIVASSEHDENSH